jgi:hypothetical protein
VKVMKKTILITLVAFVATVAFASVVMAKYGAAVQSASAQESKLERFSGVIEKVDKANKDIQVQFLRDKKTFFLDKNTKIIESNVVLPSSDLKKEMWALVEYKKIGNKRVAEVIQVPMGDVY